MNLNNIRFSSNRFGSVKMQELLQTKTKFIYLLRQIQIICYENVNEEDFK